MYITSTFTASSIDEDRNVGFLIRFYDDVDVQNKTMGKIGSMAFKYLSTSSFVSTSAESSPPGLGLTSDRDPAGKGRSPLEFVEAVCREIKFAAAADATTGAAGAASTNKPTNSSGSHPTDDHDDASSPSTNRDNNPEKAKSTNGDDPCSSAKMDDKEEQVDREEKNGDEEGKAEEKGIEIIKKDLMSLASARRGTGLVEWGVYRVKRYIWAS